MAHIGATIAKSAEELWFDFRHGEEEEVFVVVNVSRPSLVPVRPPVQWGVELMTQLYVVDRVRVCDLHSFMYLRGMVLK